MNQKAFTLVEVLAVIVILGLIVTIVYPTVVSTVNNSKEKAYNDQKEIILKAAKEYYLENNNELYYYIIKNSSATCSETNCTDINPNLSNTNLQSFDEYCKLHSDATIKNAGEEVTVTELIAQGYISDEQLKTIDGNKVIINPVTDGPLEGLIEVTWPCSSNQYVYEFKEQNT